jgi:hypothetical protein
MFTRNIIIQLAAIAALGLTACGSHDHGNEAPGHDDNPLAAVVGNFDDELSELELLTAAHEDLLGDATTQYADISSVEALYEIAAEESLTSLRGVIEEIAACSHHGSSADADEATVTVDHLLSEMGLHGGAMTAADDMTGALVEEGRHQGEMAEHFTDLHNFVGMFDFHEDHFECEGHGDQHADEPVATHPH